MEQQEDEISLLDLLLVLLKHWKLVLFLPLAAVLSMGVYTIFKNNQPKAAPLTESSISFSVNPLVKQFVGDINIEDSIASIYLQDISLLYDVINRVGITKIAEYSLPADREEGLFFIKNLLIDGKKLSGSTFDAQSRPYTVTRKANVIQMTVRFPLDDVHKVFYEQILERIEGSINALIVPVAQKEVQDYERLLAESSSSASKNIQDILISRFSAYTSAQRYLRGEEKLFLVSEPVLMKTLKQNTGRQTFVLVLFAALFFAIFAAFILEWIHSIQKDPEAMAKIREALSHSKKE